MLANKKQTEFVESVFEYYHLNKYGYFNRYDENSDKSIEIPLIIDNRLAHTLGMTVDEIKSMDKNAAMRWSNKYPFFKYYRSYDLQWSLKSRYADGVTQEDMLLKAIFGEMANVDVKERYDYEDVKRRLVSQLKKIDEAIPGTYHDGASFTKLEISTEVFLSFPQASKMLSSFIDIYNTVERLFFKALTDELSNDEIQEYDFLVSFLQVTDIVMPSSLMTYDLVKSYRSVYLAEDYHNLTSYARIRSFIGTSPWRCKEFFDDLDLVQKFATIFPETKAQMREFSMKVSNFECFFTWSDAKPITYSPEEEEEMREFCDMVGEDYLEPQDRAKEPTLIYVPKTNEEMLDWAFYVKQIKKLAQPSSKGGLLLPKPEADAQSLHDVRRTMMRVECRHGGGSNG